MRRFLLPLLLLLLWLPAAAGAAGIDTPLPDPGQEARARAVAHELRCLVCQNESIADSDAPLAADLRRILRQRIAAGDSDAQAKAYLVDRYGQWILLRPPFEPATWILWCGPFLLLAGLAGWIALRRRRMPKAEEAPLTAEEQARLDALLKDQSP